MQIWYSNQNQHEPSRLPAPFGHSFILECNKSAVTVHAASQSVQRARREMQKPPKHHITLLTLLRPSAEGAKKAPEAMKSHFTGNCQPFPTVKSLNLQKPSKFHLPHHFLSHLLV